MSVFLSRQPAEKTVEQKRVSRLANRTSKASRQTRKPGPVFAIVQTEQKQ